MVESFTAILGYWTEQVFSRSSALAAAKNFEVQPLFFFSSVYSKSLLTNQRFRLQLKIRTEKNF